MGGASELCAWDDHNSDSVPHGHRAKITNTAWNWAFRAVWSLSFQLTQITCTYTDYIWSFAHVLMSIIIETVYKNTANNNKNQIVLFLYVCSKANPVSGTVKKNYPGSVFPGRRIGFPSAAFLIIS